MTYRFVIPSLCPKPVSVQVNARDLIEGLRMAERAAARFAPLIGPPPPGLSHEPVLLLAPVGRLGEHESSQDPGR